MAKLTLDLEDEINERLKILAVKRKTMVTPLLREAAKALASSVEQRGDGSFFVKESGVEDDPSYALEAKSHSGDQRSPNAEWHNLLDAVLTSGVEEAVTAIQENLKMFAVATRAGSLLPKETRAAVIRELMEGNPDPKGQIKLKRRNIG